MSAQEPQPLPPTAEAILTELRKWAGNLPPNSVVVREEYSKGYGGLLFEVRPVRPGAVHFTVGLGGVDFIDFYWDGGYRWDGWEATAEEVIEVCDAIRAGEVFEETWKLGGFVIEKRCNIRLRGGNTGDGSFPKPAWLKRWARVSVRTFSPWN